MAKPMALDDAELSQISGGYHSYTIDSPYGPEYKAYLDDDSGNSCWSDMAAGWNANGFSGAAEALRYSPNCLWDFGAGAPPTFVLGG
jgi:hypothetical protein